MPPKPSRWPMYAKMLIGGSILCIGGPALVIYVTPTEEEIFLRYNPELQKRSLENRYQKQADFDSFVTKLKQYSKSDKPIWLEAAADEKKIKDGKMTEQATLMEEIRRRKEEIRAETGGKVKGVPGGSSPLES